MLLTAGLVAASAVLAVGGHVVARKRPASKGKSAVPTAEFLAKAAPISARVVTEIPIVVDSSGDAGVGFSEPEPPLNHDGDGFRKNFGDAEPELEGVLAEEPEDLNPDDQRDHEIMGEGTEAATLSAPRTSELPQHAQRGVGFSLSRLVSPLLRLFGRSRQALAAAAPKVSHPNPFGDDEKFESNAVSNDMSSVNDIVAPLAQTDPPGPVVLDGDALLSADEPAVAAAEADAVPLTLTPAVPTIGFAAHIDEAEDGDDAVSWLTSDEELAEAAAMAQNVGAGTSLQEQRHDFGAHLESAPPAEPKPLEWTRAWAEGDLATDARVELVKRIILIDDEEYYGSLVDGYREDAVVRAAVPPLVEALQPKHAIALLRVMLEEGPLTDATLAIDEFASLGLFDELAPIIRDGEPQLVSYAVFRLADEVDTAEFATRHGLNQAVLQNLGQTA